MKRYEIKEVDLEGLNGCYQIIDNMFSEGVREIFHYKDGETKSKAFDLVTEICERLNGIQIIADKQLGNDVKPKFN